MNTYTDKEIAAVAWAANAELQALHGDPAPSLPGDLEDAEAHAVTVAGIRAVLEGATPERLHEAWCRAREAQGWKHGPHKDSRLKTHPALVPYADLPEHQRVKDSVFAAIVRAMAGQDARPATGSTARKLEIAMTALRQINQDGDNYSACATAETALADIADVHLAELGGEWPDRGAAENAL